MWESQQHEPSNNRMKLTAPLGGRAVYGAWSRPPRAHSPAVAAAYPGCWAGGHVDIQQLWPPWNVVAR